MSNRNATSSSGIGFFGTLTILFIALKLCHVVHWSWWWVVMPVWMTATFCVVVLLAFLVLSDVNED